MKCPFCIKVCSSCGRILVAYSGNFVKGNGKYNLYSKCKLCKSKMDKKYREEHREELLEKQKQYREKHREELLEKQKQWYKNNEDKIKQYREEHKEETKEYMKNWRNSNIEHRKNYDKQYREKHKEEKKEYMEDYKKNHKKEIIEYSKQYYEKNKERILKRQRKYKKDNKHIVFNNHQKRRIKEENQGKGITSEQWLEMMLWFDFKCAYSGEYIGGNSEHRTVDHIIALNNNGLNEIWNCIPCYDSYNYSKNTKDMEEWYREQPYFSEERLVKIYEWIEYAYEKWGEDDK